MASLNASTACCTPTLWNRPTPTTPLRASNPRGLTERTTATLCNKFLLGGGGGSQYLLLQPQRHGSSCTSAHRLLFFVGRTIRYNENKGYRGTHVVSPLLQNQWSSSGGWSLRLASNRAPVLPAPPPNWYTPKDLVVGVAPGGGELD
jgi:hypothetical protein